MTLRLSTSDADFAAAFTTLVDARREADEDVSRDVAAILKAVRAGGEGASNRGRRVPSCQKDRG